MGRTGLEHTKKSPEKHPFLKDAAQNPAQWKIDPTMRKK